MPTKAHYAACGVRPPIRVNIGNKHHPAKKYSKRDFESFARAVRTAREKLASDCENTNTITDKALNEIVWGLCVMFKEDNPEFEELRFIGACSLTV